MKFFPALAILCLPYFAQAQCFVTSTGLSTNYTVSISANPYTITKHCNGGGYTFEVNVAYYVTFSPAMPSGGLYTLQGTVNCGNQAGTGNIFFDLPNSGGYGNAVSSTASTNKSDCATADAQSLGCGSISIQINGPGISNRTINCPVVSLLPVQIVNFSAIANNGKVETKWTTVSEQNNSHFTLEKSANGIDFFEVTKVAALGNAGGNYTAIDNTPFEGLSYYRIKQPDNDGQVNYTHTETVKIDLSSIRWFVYPNPNASNQLHFSGVVDNRIIELFSAAGKKIFSAELKGAAITLPHLTKGLYTLKLINKKDNSFKVIKYLQQ